MAVLMYFDAKTSVDEVLFVDDSFQQKMNRQSGIQFWQNMRKKGILITPVRGTWNVCCCTATSQELDVGFFCLSDYV